MNVLPSSNSDGDKRGQTEPLVALLAVAIMGIALSLYSGHYTAILSSSESEENLVRPTLERAWTEMQDRGAYNEQTPLENAVRPQALPEGETVYIWVTYINDTGQTVVVDGVKFNPDGQTEPFTNKSAPPGTNSESRPISVRYGNRDVRGGRLHVAIP